MPCRVVRGYGDLNRHGYCRNHNCRDFCAVCILTTFSSETNSYTITGFDTDSAEWTGMTSDQKANIAIVIPAEYSDDMNGEHPVTAIGEEAFQADKYTGYTFTSLVVSAAVNLTTIGNSAINRDRDFKKTIKKQSLIRI